MITMFNLMFDVEWMDKAEDYDDFFDFLIKPDFFFGEVSVETDEGGVEVVPFATSTWTNEYTMYIYLYINNKWEGCWIGIEYLPGRLQDCFDEDIQYYAECLPEDRKPRRKDNSRKAKELAKERKANRIKAKERRGEQWWHLYGVDWRDKKDIVPIDPWKLKTRKEKRLEAFAKEMLRDDDNPTWEQVNSLLEEEKKAKQFITEQNDLLTKMRKERSELLTKLSRLELEIDKKEEMVNCYGNRFKP